jgi:glyoxylase I family protein
MADWYCKHLGLSVVHRLGNAYFFGDESGHGIFEVYCSPPDQVPDYRNMNPKVLHLAFLTEDIVGDYARLLAAGATPEGDPPVEGEKYGLAMMRDPWGVPIQLACRETRMVK